MEYLHQGRRLAGAERKIWAITVVLLFVMLYNEITCVATISEPHMSSAGGNCQKVEG